MISESLEGAVTSLIYIIVIVLSAAGITLVAAWIPHAGEIALFSGMLGLGIYCLSLIIPARVEGGRKFYRPIPFHALGLGVGLFLVLSTLAVPDQMGRVMVFSLLLLLLGMGGVAAIYLWRNLSFLFDRDQDAIPDIFDADVSPQPIRLIPVSSQRKADDLIAGPDGSHESARDIIAFVKEVERRTQLKLPYGQRAMRGLQMPSGRYPCGLGDPLYTRITTILEQAGMWERGNPGRLLFPADEVARAIRGGTDRTFGQPVVTEESARCAAAGQVASTS